MKRTRLFIRVSLIVGFSMSAGAVLSEETLSKAEPRTRRQNIIHIDVLPAIADMNMNVYGITYERFKPDGASSWLFSYGYGKNVDLPSGVVSLDKGEFTNIHALGIFFRNYGAGSYNGLFLQHGAAYHRGEYLYEERGSREVTDATADYHGFFAQIFGLGLQYVVADRVALHLTGSLTFSMGLVEATEEIDPDSRTHFGLALSGGVGIAF